ncbi:MAG: MarR family winged helix-turn-helix transcriptional regulator [Saprospiraceae bacterium]
MAKSIGFGFYLDRTLKKIVTVFIQQFRKKGIDLTIEQWVILHRIYDMGEEASQVEISKLSYRNRATTSRVISGLCNKGLVNKQRFIGDQKRYKLVVTTKGQKIIDNALPIVDELRAVGYQKINDGDFIVFMKVVNQLWENYETFSKEQS